jgi:hypothetical protein
MSTTCSRLGCAKGTLSPHSSSPVSSDLGVSLAGRGSDIWATRPQRVLVSTNDPERAIAVQVKGGG